MTTSASPQLPKPPQAGLFIWKSAAPPAAYLMPTGIRYRPMVVITIPETKGGNQCRMRPMMVPSAAWNSPATTTDPISAAMPDDLTMPIMIGTKAKLVPCITGNRAPTGPKPMVWNRVATPANSIAIWIRNTMSAPPNANPAAPATIMEGVTLLANIARTC